MEEFLLESLGPEWFEKLKEHFDTPWFLQMAGAISSEREKRMVYPQSDDVFRAFKETPFSKVKVIMLGQDPNNSPKEANGIAFDCSNVNYICPSFKKVLEEYDREFPNNFSTDLMNGNILRWCHEGVFMLNTALTVPHKDPGKHQLIWQPFISKVIDLLAWDENPKVFVHLGAEAKKYSHMVRNPHLKFIFEHPAAATYGIPRAWNAPGIFRNINAGLEQLGVQPVEW